MAQLKSSKKDIRRTARRTIVNKVYRDNYKSAVKGLRLEIAKASVETSSIVAAQKAIDKARKKGILKRNTASRLKSRLMKQANKSVK